MQKIPRKPRLRGVPRIAFAAALTALTLWTVGVAATAHSLSDAAERLRQETALPLALLRYEMGGEEADELSLGASLALSLTPILADARSEVTQAWSSELQLPPDETKPDTEDHEGTTLSDAQTGETVPRGADNGVPSRTLRVGDPSGYTVLGNVCINNGSKCTLDASQLTGAPAAAECPADGPQVLIVHTHGTEAYTMPAGEEYEASDDHRTLEKEKNMIRVGDEIARVLTDAGLGVLHDRELYDYPNYSGAYNRSLAAIEKYRAEYPSLLYILDVHRDAVADSEGNNYKLLCAEEPGAAQLEFVIGSSGGGLEHPDWRENLKLACAVQETLYAKYPTLMRPRHGAQLALQPTGHDRLSAHRGRHGGQLARRGACRRAAIRRGLCRNRAGIGKKRSRFRDLFGCLTLIRRWDTSWSGRRRPPARRSYCPRSHGRPCP